MKQRSWKKDQGSWCERDKGWGLWLVDIGDHDVKRIKRKDYERKRSNDYDEKKIKYKDYDGSFPKL